MRGNVREEGERKKRERRGTGVMGDENGVRECTSK